MTTLGERFADAITSHVTCRLEIDNDDGAQVVEQQAYYRAEEGRIVWMRVLCSGFRPRE
jgi:hypothetical protein